MYSVVLLMRPDISSELLKAINERIHLDLLLHILNKKFIKAENEGNDGFAKYLDKIIKDVSRQRKEVNDYLRQNGVKIFDPEKVDDMFIQYRYYQKVNGGYKEGVQRYWRDAIKFQLKKRLSKYFVTND